MSVLLVASVSACVEEIPDVNDELALGRCLTPTEASVNVSTTDGQTVTFTWVTSKGPSNYYIEIFKGDEDANPETVFEGTPVKTLTPETSPAKVVLDADSFYFARIKAQKTDSKIDDSKWLSFPYPIGTYEVKPSVSPALVERTETSISLKWTQADEYIVDHVRVSPNPDGDKAYKSYIVPAANKGDEVTFSVDGLKPSVKYTVAVHYKSANRGEIYVWTRPSLKEATVVKNTEELIAALTGGAPLIQVEYSDAPYNLYTVEGVENKNVAITPSETGLLKIVGNGTLDGKMPTVTGVLNIPDGVTELYLEGIAFDGADYSFSHPVVLADKISTEIKSITMLNCDVTAYRAGFFYYNLGKANIGDLIFKNIMVSDILGDGGNAFDIRSDVNINKIDISESTFTNGIRTFVRIDNAKVASMYFNKNTVNNLCFVENGNNKGLFYIGGGKGQVSIPVFEMTKNLFINLNGNAARTVFFSDEVGVPTKISSNYYFKLGAGFWAKDDNNSEGKGKLTQAKGLADGGVILSGDPCENSSEGIFYVKKTSAVYSKGIGDPRWLENYVPVVEDLSLTPVEYGKAWTLNNTKLYGATVKKELVRDNLRFFVNTLPFNVLESGLEFTGAGVVGATGIPSDGALAFKINGPGSIILSVAKSRSGSNYEHLTVALGDAEGKSAAVAGSAFVGGEKIKIAFPKVEAGAEHIVYLYTCGPLVLTAMQWSDNVDTGAPVVLDTPVLSIDQEYVDETFEGNVTVSWQDVNYADSYILTVNGESKTVKGTEYVMTPSGMAVGKYEITVQAIVAEGDLSKENSEISETLVFEIKEILKAVSKSNPTVWDSEYFGNVAGYAGTEAKNDFVYGNLGFLANGGSFKFGQNEFDGVKYNRVQSGSGTPGTKACYQIKVAGPGTLEVKAISSGSARSFNVALGSELVKTFAAPDKSAAIATETVSFTADEIGEEAIINIYSSGGSVNYFSFTWTPAGYDPDAGIPFDETAINETYLTDYSDETKYPNNAAWLAKGQSTTIDKITYVALSGKDMGSEPSKPRLKPGGKSELGADGIPTGGYASFRITKPGTVTFKMISGNEGDAPNRYVHVILVKTVDGANKIEELYYAASDPKGADPARTLEITKEQLSDTKETATVYFYCSGNAVNFYQLGFAPAE